MTAVLYPAQDPGFRALAQRWLPVDVPYNLEAAYAVVAMRDDRPVGFAVLTWLDGHLAVQHVALEPRVEGLKNPWTIFRALWPMVRDLANRLGQGQVIIPVECWRQQLPWIRRVLSRLGGSTYAVESGYEWWAIPLEASA